MVLSDVDIKKHLDEGKIIVKPLPDLSKALGSSSLDLRLGDTFRVFNHSKISVIDPFKKYPDVTTKIIVKKDETFILHPQEFVLGVTKESLELPNSICARLEGRSSLGRLGIVVHSTAGSIAAGWQGHLTLELANMGRIPVILYPNMRICAVSFEILSSPAQNLYYKPKYQNISEPGESKLNQEL